MATWVGFVALERVGGEGVGGAGEMSVWQEGGEVGMGLLGSIYRGVSVSHGWKKCDLGSGLPGNGGDFIEKGADF